MKRLLMIGCLVLGTTGAWAYGPLFVPHLQVPGEHVADLLTGVYHDRGGWAVGQDIGFGLPHEVGASFGISIDANQRKIQHAHGELLWRAYNDDYGLNKDAVVFNLTDQVSSTGDSQIGHFASGAVGYLVDHLGWIAIAAARVDDRHPELGAQGIGVDPHTHVPWIDLAYGWRFMRDPKTQSDAMFAVSSNSRLSAPWGEFLGPQLLVQPYGVVLLKVGYQFPLVTQIPQEKGQWAYEMEYRF